MNTIVGVDWDPFPRPMITASPAGFGLVIGVDPFGKGASGCNGLHLIGMIITAFLSNDATALILTPLVAWLSLHNDDNQAGRFLTPGAIILMSDLPDERAVAPLLNHT